MHKTAAVSGTRIRYDVPSKCQAVAAVLEQKYSSKEEQAKFISELAADMEVNSVTIKAWVFKYHKTYRLGMQLQKGVMSHAFTVVENDKIPAVNVQLAAIRSAIVNMRETYETSSVSGRNAADLRTRHTPKEILNELIENRKED